MSADIDRQKLRELCERATPVSRVHALEIAGYWFKSARKAHAAGKLGEALFDMENAYNHVEGALIAERDAQAAKIAELEAEVVAMQSQRDEWQAIAIDARREVDSMKSDLASLESERDQLKAENASLRERADAPEDRTWFWEIVDRDGLANVASDERQALADLCRAAAERDQLRKQVEGRFVAGLRQAVNVIKGIEIWDSPDADAEGDAFDTAYDAILSAASALEQKEQG